MVCQAITSTLLMSGDMYIFVYYVKRDIVNDPSSFDEVHELLGWQSMADVSSGSQVTA